MANEISGVETRRDSAELLVCQVVIPADLDAASRERELHRLADTVLPAERASGRQRTILLLLVARGQFSGTTTDVVVAMDVLTSQEAMLKELLADARLRKYIGSGPDAYRFLHDYDMWYASIAAKEGWTIPVFDFVTLMDL